MNNQAVKTAETIRALAARHGIAYVATGTDEWAAHITRLAGDDVALDSVELLLIELQRTGHLTNPEALTLQVNYLREVGL